MGCEGFMDAGKNPTIEEITEYVGESKGYWCDLTTFISDNYGVSPKMTFSKCAAKPGWNVKYQKSGKSLCTLYPEKDSFTALVVVNEKEIDQISIRLGAFGYYFTDVFKNAGSLNGCRWLMLEVADKTTLDDIKEVLMLKVKPKRKNDKKLFRVVSKNYL